MKKNKKGMLGNLIGGFIVIIMGVMLFPMIVDEIEGASYESNLTGTGTGGKIILTMISLVFALGIMMVALGLAVNALRSAGLIYSGEDEDDKDSDDEEEEEEEDDEDEEDKEDEEFDEEDTEEEPKDFKEKEIEEQEKFIISETFKHKHLKRKKVSESKLNKSRFD